MGEGGVSVDVTGGDVGVGVDCMGAGVCVHASDSHLVVLCFVTHRVWDLVHCVTTCGM